MDASQNPRGAIHSARAEPQKVSSGDKTDGRLTDLEESALHPWRIIRLARLPTWSRQALEGDGQ
jgi:hypothetical protein